MTGLHQDIGDISCIRTWVTLRLCWLVGARGVSRSRRSGRLVRAGVLDDEFAGVVGEEGDCRGVADDVDVFACQFASEVVGDAAESDAAGGSDLLHVLAGLDGHRDRGCRGGSCRGLRARWVGS